MDNANLKESPVEANASLKEESSCVLGVQPAEPISHASENSSDMLIIDWISNQQNSQIADVRNFPDCSEVDSNAVRKTGEHEEISSKRNKRKTHCSADVATTAFRQSQHILRKEGKHVSMKEVISKTFPAYSPLSSTSQEESVRSLDSLTPSLSSPWSPQVANDLTSQFLSAVEQKKKRKFEHLISVNSSKSFSFGNYASDSNAPMMCSEEELIICDEDANMGPPFSPDDPLLFPADSSKMDLIASLNNSKRLGEEYNEKGHQREELVEKERIAALSRKHRIWEMQRQKRQTVDALKSLATSTAATKSSLSHHNGMEVKSTGISDPASEPSEYFPTITPLHRIRSANDQSVSQSNLSMDDISMIQRINSFDKTAAQHMVVFTSTSKKEK